MSIIVLHGVPSKWNLLQVVKTLAPIIGGQFEALNFGSGNQKYKKVCYLRLSERLDPQQVVEKINGRPVSKNILLKAIIPREVPDIPLAKKTVKIPQRLSRMLNIPKEHLPEQAMTHALIELLAELQTKFTGLYNLSRKYQDKLLERISKMIVERLKPIMEKTNNQADCFKLTKRYRKLHPHTSDIQMIISTLQQIEDEAGTPRTQITEQELTTVNSQLYVIDNLPFDKVQQTCQKYTDKISKKITDHIEGLNCEIDQCDSEEDVARKKVREELKKLVPYLPVMISQVVKNNLIPEKPTFHRMCIYGEPYLPSTELMSSFVRRHNAVRLVRSKRIYNLIRLNIPQQRYSSLIAMDGTVVGGAKMIIRSQDVPLYQIPYPLFSEIKALYGSADMEYEDQEEPHYDVNEGESWTEDIMA